MQCARDDATNGGSIAHYDAARNGSAGDGAEGPAAGPDGAAESDVDAIDGGEAEPKVGAAAIAAAATPPSVPKGKPMSKMPRSEPPPRTIAPGAAKPQVAHAARPQTSATVAAMKQAATAHGTETNTAPREPPLQQPAVVRKQLPAASKDDREGRLQYQLKPQTSNPSCAVTTPTGAAEITKADRRAALCIPSISLGGVGASSASSADGSNGSSAPDDNGSSALTTVRSIRCWALRRAPTPLTSTATPALMRPIATHLELSI